MYVRCKSGYTHILCAVLFLFLYLTLLRFLLFYVLLLHSSQIVTAGSIRHFQTLQVSYFNWWKNKYKYINTFEQIFFIIRGVLSPPSLTFLHLLQSLQWPNTMRGISGWNDQLFLPKPWYWRLLYRHPFEILPELHQWEWSDDWRCPSEGGDWPHCPFCELHPHHGLSGRSELDVHLLYTRIYSRGWCVYFF